MQPPIVLSVSQLTSAVKSLLEDTFPFVSVRGEISNLKLQSSGHMYFTIKDEWAQLSCVMFKQELSKVNIPLKVGDAVILQGSLNVYPQRGNYQLVVRSIALMGLGELLLKLEQLKQKLKMLGYFDEARKKKLPPFPKTIGVVTSPTGSVIRDIIHILTRRLRGFHLILNPVKVQGEGAADEIAQAIYEFNEHALADVIIVCRGGGSFEDLMPFNDEKVAKAIFESSIPVISAVGHETDVSISDFVADLRAPTPSAAAEIVSYETEAFLSHLKKTRHSLTQHIVKNLQKKEKELVTFAKNPLLSTFKLLRPYEVQLDDYKEVLNQDIRRYLLQKKLSLSSLQKTLEAFKPNLLLKTNFERLKKLQKELKFALEKCISKKKETIILMNTTIDRTIFMNFKGFKRTFLERQFEKKLPQLLLKEIGNKRQRLETLVSHLNSLNPKTLLNKGYSILFSQKDGSVISSISKLKIDDKVHVLLSDGKAQATINEVTS